MKKVVCTFANYPISKGFERYRKEVESFGIFDQILTYDENDLKPEFKRKFGRYLHPYSRGYGYWGWKPLIIKQTLDKINQGDILLYTDLGCSFNLQGIHRMNEYLEIVNNSESGILGVRAQEISSDGRYEVEFYDYQWTKGDVFDFFGVRDDQFYTHTKQFEATIVFLKKNASSMAFINEWVDVVYNHFDLLTDRRSKSSNFDGFVENRHDQSIFSILAKKYKADSISRNEISPNQCDKDGWNIMYTYPIWAKREIYYKSPWHYKHRFQLRKWYGRWWGVKYAFKNLIP